MKEAFQATPESRITYAVGKAAIKLSKAAFTGTNIIGRSSLKAAKLGYNFLDVKPGEFRKDKVETSFKKEPTETAPGFEKIINEDEKIKEESKKPDLLSSIGDIASNALGALGAGGLLLGAKKLFTRKTATKAAERGVAKEAVKVEEKAVEKVASKSLGKSLLKKLPVIGLVAGGLFAAQRALSGDYAGASMELASGAASTIPGVGTAASLGIDAALAAKDLGAFESEEKDRGLELSKTAQQVEAAKEEKETAKAKAAMQPVVDAANRSVQNNIMPGASGNANQKQNPRNPDNSISKWLDSRVPRFA